MLRNERASVFEATQIGLEAIPGDRVAALKRLLATTIRLAPNIPVDPYRPQGSKAPTTATKGKEWTTGDIEGRIAFNDLCYLLSACLGTPTITTPPGATDTRRWVWTPRNWGPDNVKTFTVERGGGGYAESASYMLVNGLTLRVNNTEAAVTGNILAQEPDYDARMSTNEVQTVNLQGATGGTFTLSFMASATGALAYNITAAALQTALEALATVGAGNVLVTLTSPGVYSVEFTRALGQQNVASLVIDGALLTGGGPGTVTTATAGEAPTDVPEVPADTDRASIWLGDTVANLARVRRVQEFEWGISDRFVGQFNIDDEEASFSTHVERGPGMGAQVTMERDDDAKTLIAYMRQKVTQVVRLQILGPEIEAGFPHKLWLTFPHKYRDPRNGSAQETETGQIEFFNVYDSVFGGFLQVEIDCALTGLT